MIQDKLKYLGQTALAGDAKGIKQTDSFARSFDYGEREGSFNLGLSYKF